MIPNLQHEVEVARQKYPEAWRNAHTGNAQTEDFIRLLARDVRAEHGPRWGLNGKRGGDDISDDVLAYSGEGSAIDVQTGGPMEIIDVIVSAGGPNAAPTWNPGPGGPGDRGKFIGSFAVPSTPGGQPTGPSSWLPSHTAALASLPASAGTEQIARAFASMFPLEAWGTKRASATRPISNDVIARQLATGLVGYRVVPRPAGAPAELDLSGQVFVPASGPIVVTPPPVTPPPPTFTLPSAGELVDEGQKLSAFYSAPEGLQRPQGLSISGGPDWGGLGAWLFDVYLPLRTQGKSREDARAEYVRRIRQSDEWRAKHPGETP